MGCSGCSSGGCGSELPIGCKNNGSCVSGGCNKLSVFNWLSNIQEPTNEMSFNGVEVRFDNRKKKKGNKRRFYKRKMKKT